MGHPQYPHQCSSPPWLQDLWLDAWAVTNSKCQCSLQSMRRAVLKRRQCRQRIKLVSVTSIQLRVTPITWKTRPWYQQSLRNLPLYPVQNRLNHRQSLISNSWSITAEPITVTLIITKPRLPPISKKTQPILMKRLSNVAITINSTNTINRCSTITAISTTLALYWRLRPRLVEPVAKQIITTSVQLQTKQVSSLYKSKVFLKNRWRHWCGQLQWSST